MSRGSDRVLAEILDHLAEEYVGVMEKLDAEIDTDRKSTRLNSSHRL